MSFEVKALMTDEARRRIAEQWATGKSFVVVGFSLGAAGHDPLDPSTPLAPDPATTTLEDVVFGPKAVSSFTFASDTCPVFECFLDFSEAVAEFSSVGLLAQITSSPIPGDPELNSTFLFAVSNFAKRPKTDLEQLTINVGISR